jgi:hypothetical protein
MFCSEEKAEARPAEPKDFYSCVHGNIRNMDTHWEAAEKVKVFCFFSSEKKILPYFFKAVFLHP